MPILTSFPPMENGGSILITTISVAAGAISKVQEECLQQPTYIELENGVKVLCRVKQKPMPKITINTCTHGALAQTISFTIFSLPIAILETSDIPLVQQEEVLKQLQMVDGVAMPTVNAMSLSPNLTLTSCGIPIIIQVLIVLTYNSGAILGREFFFNFQDKDSQILVNTQRIQ